MGFSGCSTCSSSSELDRSRISILTAGEEYSWALNALKDISQVRSDLTDEVRQAAEKEHGIMRASLLFAVKPDDQEEIFCALAELLKMTTEQINQEPIELLSHLDLNWLGREKLLVAILHLRCMSLAYNLLESVYGLYENKIGAMDIGPIEWWLDWLMENSGTQEWWFFQDRLSHLFATHLTPEGREAFVSEFNKQWSPYRRVLARTILIARNDLTTEHFSEDAISFLLADLSREKSWDSHHGHLLSRTATETFVAERLLPLLSDAQEPFRSNLTEVLRHGGRRHGRRYVTT
jgi:hypothetical protein